MSFFVLIEVTHKTNKTFSPIFDLFQSVGVEPLQTICLIEDSLGLTFLGRIMLRKVEILKLQSAVFADPILDDLGLLNETLKHLTVIPHDFFFLWFLALGLLVQFYFFKHVDLFFQKVVDQQIYQSRYVGRNNLVWCSRQQGHNRGVVVHGGLLSDTPLSLFVQKLELLLSQLLALIWRLKLYCRTTTFHHSSWLGVTLASIICRILVLMQHCYLWFVLSLIANTFLLDFPLQPQQLLSLLLNLCKPRFVSLLILGLFLSFLFYHPF